MNFSVFIHCFLFGMIIITSLIKGNYHFKYLKSIKPEEYSLYPNYYSVFTDKYINISLQFLAMPFFSRKKTLENENAAVLAKKVRAALIIHLLAILALILLIYNNIANS